MFKLIKRAYTKHLDAEVEKYWQIYHFDMNPNHISYNNEGDAFKHTFWQAEMTLWFGEAIANKIGVAWEDNNPNNTPAERKMDLHNNQRGREIGITTKKHYPFWFFIKYDDIIAEAVMFMMQQGLLITKP